ncbi:MAG: hypothetical protein ACJA01_003615 [Saprospiraceae bacterium]|jgi:hypothetical protein
MAKYKMTGCARFFLFLIILGPIAYFGSKFLLDNGHLDNLKDKIEQRDTGTTIDTSPETISINPSNEDLSRLQNRFDELIKGYLEQEATIKEQAIVIAQQNQELENLKTNVNSRTSPNTRTSNTTTPINTGTTTPSSTTGSASLDDLLREADQNLGTTPTTPTPTNTGRQTLGNWQFSFSGVQGSIELYQDRGKSFSKTTINGSGQMNVDELTRQGDRFNVVGSQTGEYYIVKSNGDLDAYDQNGYQTTCRKS